MNQMAPAQISAARALISTALDEDLHGQPDLTSVATIPEALSESVDLVARTSGTLCGMDIIEATYQQVDQNVQVERYRQDGDALKPGDVIAKMTGPVRSLLTGERTVLNLVTHLCGVATLTAEFVDAVRGTSAVILDTRKTLPAYRLIQKYAVTCGGGRNHRMGLYDGILIKDNHLAAQSSGDPAAAVRAARAYLQENSIAVQVEIEVDSLEQLRRVLPAMPDIVLLDNMNLEDLNEAVAFRNQNAPDVQLEASGGVTLSTVGAIAGTGVDRISIGALTHSAPALDLGFDWPTTLG